MNLSLVDFKKCFPNITDINVQKYYKEVMESSEKYFINTPLRLAHFFAQIGHESASFLYYREIASGAAYDTGKLAVALGNTPEADGDGQKYKGRGIIQITGKANYKRMSNDIFGDNRLISQPELLELPKYGVLSACIFWNWKQLNAKADMDNLRGITKAINGGYNGFSDRERRLIIAKKVFNLI